MARNMRDESEFGLGLMPIAKRDGRVVDGASGAPGLPLAENDLTAVLDGADLSVASELRMIYARDTDTLPQ